LGYESDSYGLKNMMKYQVMNVVTANWLWSYKLPSRNIQWYRMCLRFMEPVLGLLLDNIGNGFASLFCPL
jgi:hypothetical protein